MFSAQAMQALPWCGLAALFGLTVGVSELIGRYRVEPFNTLTRRYGVAYLVVNAATSAAVAAFVFAYKKQVFPELEPLGVALVCGFGAMALLRSKFFTFRTKLDEDIPVGLDAVVRVFLAAIDRGIDRAQASERWARTFPALRDVPEGALADLFATLRANLGSYENVSAEALQAFNTTLAGLIDQKEVSPGLRAVSAGLAFQVTAGTANFGDVVKRFRAQNSLPPAASSK